MSKKAEIKKIVLDLGDKEIELSVTQAEKLTELLGNMFGKKEVTIAPSYPIVIERYRPYWIYGSQTWDYSSSGSYYIPENSSLCLSVG